MTFYLSIIINWNHILRIFVVLIMQTFMSHIELHQQCLIQGSQTQIAPGAAWAGHSNLRAATPKFCYNVKVYKNNAIKQVSLYP